MEGGREEEMMEEERKRKNEGEKGRKQCLTKGDQNICVFTQIIHSQTCSTYNIH